jgi:mannose-6-phosphate isomerase-like protein (cupin superfamily)
MVEKVFHNGELLAIILRDGFVGGGVTFLTPDDFSQQLAHMRHPPGKAIDPHVHNLVERSITYTQEVLFIKRGSLRVDFYDGGHAYLHSRILNAGDVILLSTGGHGFQVLEELEMIEVKQGPYVGDSHKTRFAPVPEESVRLILATSPTDA